MYNGNIKWGFYLYLIFNREGFYIGGVRFVFWGGVINIYYVCVVVVLIFVEIVLIVYFKFWK